MVKIATSKTVAKKQAEIKEQSFLELLAEHGLPAPTALNWGQMETISEEGLDPVENEDFSGPKMMKLMKWIVRNVYSDHVTPEIPGDLLMRLAAETFGMTYGTFSGRKN